MWLIYIKQSVSSLCLCHWRWSSAADTWLSVTWKWTFGNIWLKCFRTLGNYSIFYIISYSLFSNSFNILCDAIIMICAWALDWSLMSKTKRDTLSKPHKLSPVWYILWPRCVRVTAAQLHAPSHSHCALTWLAFLLCKIRWLLVYYIAYFL